MRWVLRWMSALGVEGMCAGGVEGGVCIPMAVHWGVVGEVYIAMCVRWGC